VAAALVAVVTLINWQLGPVSGGIVDGVGGPGLRVLGGWLGGRVLVGQTLEVGLCVGNPPITVDVQPEQVPEESRLGVVVHLAVDGWEGHGALEERVLHLLPMWLVPIACRWEELLERVASLGPAVQRQWGPGISRRRLVDRG